MKARHRGSFYRQRPGGGDDWGSPASSWGPTPIAADVPVNLQPLSGRVSQAGAGRQARVTMQGFVDPRDLPADVLIRPDDGLVITEGRSPARFRVVHVALHTSGWKDQLLLEETAEDIP